MFFPHTWYQRYIRICVCACVCVTGNQSMECFQIMRWWSSNLEQWTLWKLVYVVYWYIFILVPSHPPFTPHDVLPGGGRPLLPQHPLHWRSMCLSTGSSAHLGVTCLCPSISMFPASPLSFSVHVLTLQPSLAPAMPSWFLSSPHPCRCQICFYHDLWGYVLKRHVIISASRNPFTGK